MTEGRWPYEQFRAKFGELDPERYPLSVIDDRVYSGEWRCWGTDNAAILAEIRTYPSGISEVHGVAAVGELGDIVDLIPFAEQWGRDNGCVRAVIESRPAWGRVLPGYELHQVSVRKDL